MRDVKTRQVLVTDLSLLCLEALTDSTGRLAFMYRWANIALERGLTKKTL